MSGFHPTPELIARWDEFDSRCRTYSFDPERTVTAGLVEGLLEACDELRSADGKVPYLRPEEIEVSLTDADYCFGEVLAVADYRGLDLGYVRTDGLFRTEAGMLDEPYLMLHHALRLPTPEFLRGSAGKGGVMPADPAVLLPALQTVCAQRLNALLRYHWARETSEPSLYLI